MGDSDSSSPAGFSHETFHQPAIVDSCRICSCGTTTIPVSTSIAGMSTADRSCKYRRPSISSKVALTFGRAGPTSLGSGSLALRAGVLDRGPASSWWSGMRARSAQTETSSSSSSASSSSLDCGGAEQPNSHSDASQPKTPEQRMDLIRATDPRRFPA